jgi:hypothetical protein
LGFNFSIRDCSNLPQNRNSINYKKTVTQVMRPKYKIYSALILLFAISLKGNEAPDNLTLNWSPVSQNVPFIELRWTHNPTIATGGYRIERRIGGLAWSTTAFATVPANTATPGYFIDPLTDAAVTAAIKAANTTFTYRVRPILAATPAVLQRASEVVTAGIINTKVYDTDGDDLTDAQEALYLCNPLDWADASGDTDGDGYPNEWEVQMGRSPIDPNDQPSIGMMDGTAPWIIDVNPTAAVTATSKTSISSALTSLAGGATTAKKYRVIRVKPGIYAENLTIPTNYHVAIIPLRTPQSVYSTSAGQPSQLADSATIANRLNNQTWSPQDRFEIVGVNTSPSRPVITTTGTLVIDSFRISRPSGSRDSIISVADDATVSTVAAPRLSVCRLVNCIVANVDTGMLPLIEHTRSRLILSHCTFYMNSSDLIAPAHTYSTGVTDVLASTACLKFHNSIFWNPINISSTKPEFQSISGDGSFAGAACTLFDTGLTGALGTNPGVTPHGWISGPASSSWKNGERQIGLPANTPLQHKSIHAPRDIHGEFRYQQVLQTVNNIPTLVIGHPDEDRGSDRGADQWVDSDEDGIPDALDRQAGAISNAGLDGDSDALTELMEYLGSTDIASADSPFLTVSQARSMFTLLGNSSNMNSFYTKQEALTMFPTRAEVLTRIEADQRYVRKNPEVLETIRVAPGGNISMGQFGGSLPQP